MNAVVAWFVFPAFASRVSRSHVDGGVCRSASPSCSGRSTTRRPPQPLPGFDRRPDRAGRNLVMLFIRAALLLLPHRAAEEIGARRARARSRRGRRPKRCSKREVSHQVAERSREMGAALTRDGGDHRVVVRVAAIRFGERLSRSLRSLGEGRDGPRCSRSSGLTDSQRLGAQGDDRRTSRPRARAARFARAEAEIGGARVQRPAPRLDSSNVGCRGGRRAVPW